MEKGEKGWSKFHKARESKREKKGGKMIHGRDRWEVGSWIGLEKKTGLRGRRRIANAV